MSEEAPQPTIVMENRQGQRVDVPVAEARQRFDAGELGFPRDVPLGVYTEDGGVRALTAEQAPRIFRQGGQVLPTSDARELVASQYNREEEQRVQRDLQQEYGGAGSQALTAAEGFASEATFGLAPALLGGISPEYRRRQAARAQANPTTRTVSEISGAVIPAIGAALVPGGQGAAAAQTGRVASAAGRLARGASMLPTGQLARRAFAAEQEIAQRLAARALGTTGASSQNALRELAQLPGLRGFAQNVAARGTAGVAAGAAEGVALGLAQAIQDADLQGEEMTASGLVEAGAGGAALGAITGGGAGAVMSFLGNPRVANYINDWTDAQVLRSIGRRIPSDVAERYNNNGTAAIGGLAQELGLVGPGSTRATILSRSQSAIDDSAAGLEAVLREASGHGARISRQTQSALHGQMQRVASTRSARSALDSARGILGPLGNSRRLSLYQAHDMRSRLDALLNGTGNSAFVRSQGMGIKQAADQGRTGFAPLKDALFDVRRNLEDAIEEGFSASAWREAARRAGERTSPTGTSALGGRYGSLSRQDEQAYVRGPMVEYLQRRYVTHRQNYEVAHVVRDMVRRQPAGVIGTFLRSLRPVPVVGKVAQAAGRQLDDQPVRSALGAAGLAAASMNPTLVGAILGGSLAAASYRQGRLALPWLSDKVLQALGLRRQARVVQERIRKSILDTQRTFKPNPRLMGTVASAVHIPDYDRDTERVRQQSINPGPSVRRASENSPSALPIVAGANAAREAESIEFLSNAMPKGRIGMTLVSNTEDPDALVSDQEKSAWLLAQRAIKDPESVVKDIKAGMLSYEAVEGLRAGHPAYYRALRDSISEGIRESDERPSYEYLLTISTLFPEVPAHPSLESSMVRLLQAPYSARETGRVGGQMSQGPGPSPQPAPNLAKFEETRVQQLDSQ